MFKIVPFIFLLANVMLVKSQYEHSLAIDSRYTLFWNYSNTNLTARIQLTNVNTLTTWVSFGITNQGSLKNSDVIIAFLRSRQAPALIDAHFVGDSFIIQPDELQTWSLIAWSSSGTTLTIDFTRYILLKNIDPDGDINIVSGTPYISWAYGSPIFTSSTSNDRYVNYESATRGILPVPLLSSIKRTSKLTETLINATLTTSSKSLPSNQYDYFYCQGFQITITGSTATRHVTKYTTIFSPSTSRSYLHDWKIYFCPTVIAFTSFPTQGECDPYKTNSSQITWRNFLTNSCYAVGPMWAKGSFDTIEFPENVGFPLDFRFLVLQLHFSNPNLDRSITDTGSGVVLSYTANLRENSLGILQVGNTLNDWKSLVLLPGTVLMNANYYCYSSCSNTLQNTVSPNVVNIFASYPHTYSNGRGVKTVIVRNGMQYAIIGKNNYYNSSYQYMNYLNQTVRLGYQDQIITTCTYNTSEKENILMGNRDEVCMNYLFYYPAVTSPTTNTIQFACSSSPSLQSWSTLLTDISNAGYLRRPTSASIASFISNSTNAAALVQTISPTDNYLRQKFYDFYFYSKHFQKCNLVTGAVENNPLIPQSYLAETEDDSKSPIINSNLNIIAFSLLLIFIYLKFY